MRPIVNKTKEIRRAKYRYSWYKIFVTLFRNQRQKDFKNEKTIHLS